ncbi:amidohydrolase family protein [Desulfomicrobium escambiense]|uniref:amidohydrolase family protein n=1 Tax=Desulfomicrobium escambiense TaxID=29503 RepID=UPI001FDF2BCA|nr:amidohydrolase family protein [Desulfomicrobium escambiense]
MRWPTSLTAIMAHDAHMAAAGVTTVLDAVSAGEFSAKRMRREIFAATLEALAQALATVTANPARALGLFDRGELVHGKRADLLRVRMVDDVPVVVAVWRQGRKVM